MKYVKEKVYESVFNIAKEIAKTKDGAIFVIGSKRKLKNKYSLLFKQVLQKTYVYEKGVSGVILKLATIDGGVIISDKGELLAYGAHIKKSRPVTGLGTKHAAAAGITYAIPESTAIVVSEKADWIRVFQKGEIILETDSGKNPKGLQEKIISFLTDRDTALITTAGASAALLGFGPVLVVSGAYLVIKTATGIIKKNISKK